MTPTPIIVDSPLMYMKSPRNIKTKPALSEMIDS